MAFNDKNHVFKHFKKFQELILIFTFLAILDTAQKNTQNINASNSKDTD